MIRKNVTATFLIIGFILFGTTVHAQGGFGMYAHTMIDQDRGRNSHFEFNQESSRAVEGIQQDSVSNFSSYFDDRLIDSFWQEFKTVTPRPIISEGTIIPKIR